MLNWVKREPTSPEVAAQRGVVTFDTMEQWTAAGRKIEHAEATLIDLIEHGPFFLEEYEPRGINSEDNLNRCHLIRALGEVGGPKSVDVLVRLLDEQGDWAENIHRSAVGSLGRIGTTKAVDTLCIVMLSEGTSPSVRHNAIFAAFDAGDRRAIPALRAVTTSQFVDDKSRSIAAEVLQRLKTTTAPGPRPKPEPL